MCSEKRIEIEGEEIVKVTIPMPKKFVEFIREFGEWIGYEDVDEFMAEYVIDSLKASIWGDLDRINDVAPLKYQYFCQKYNFR